jgi:hypothetical protein
MPPYQVQYFCPGQSPYWQSGNQPYWSFEEACYWAQVLKPNSPRGVARVLDSEGVAVYVI